MPGTGYCSFNVQAKQNPKTIVICESCCVELSTVLILGQKLLESNIGYPSPIILHWCTVLKIILICCWPTCNIITSTAPDTVFFMRTWAAGNKKNCRCFVRWQACTVEVDFAGSRQAVKTANVPVAHNFCSNKNTVSQALPVAMSQVGHQWGERNGLGRREKRPKKIGWREKGSKKK